MFKFNSTNLEGLITISPELHKDSRGFFVETYKKSEFYMNGITQDFLQDNYSFSVKGVLRGLHYQEDEFAQGKLVRCVKGEIFDVAVDIRKHSKTYGMWFSIVLSEDNLMMLYIPVGFAHGFYVLSDEAEVSYKTTREYVPNADKGIIWNDKSIGIKWPSETPILSEKDKLLPKFM